jgi:aryl-alcohol dehydrogenase-like predicted oxidoreductase
MERRQLGASGFDVSRIILGCGNFGGIGSAPEFFGQGETDEQAFELMDAAWGYGITTFDTADAYGGGRSEAAIGKWISSRGYRPEIVTKTYNPMDAGQDHGLSRARVTRQLESSLDRLGVDAVDVYLAHEFDPDTPLPETVDTFEQLKQLGLVRAWGVSNFDGTHMRALFALTRPAVVQNSYSLLARGDEQDVIRMCAEFDIAYTPFGPLAGGLLSGKYRSGETPPEGSRLATRPGPYEHLLDEHTFTALKRFTELAVARGVSPSTLAVAWLLAQPAVTAVVVGPRRLEHLESAVEALELGLGAGDAEMIAALFD